MVKVRIQLLGEGGGAQVNRNPFVVASNIVKNEGFFSMYRGLSAGLLRQATYTTARMGIFRTISNSMQTQDKAPLPFYKKFFAGMAAGGLGCVLGTPADVSLIRMQSDATLPLEQRRNYKNVGDALIRIFREEGVNGMFKGNVPVIYRAMALNAGMLATYDEAVEVLAKYSDNDAMVKGSAKLLSGFCASAFSLPFDFIKTRMQKQTKLPDGTYPYRNFNHCVAVTLKNEGPGAFFRGFFTYFIRIGPHVMITMAVLEQLEKFCKQSGY